MTIEQVIPYVSLALAVGGVVYGYVKNKTAKEVTKHVLAAAQQVVLTQAAMNSTLHAMVEPLEKAVRQLPKTRSKRTTIEVDVEPPDAA